MHRSIIAAALASFIAVAAHAAEPADAERETQLQKAKSLQAAGDFPAAIRIYESLLAKDPGDGITLFEMALSHQMIKGWKECISFARRGIGIESVGQAGSYAVLATCEEGSGNIPEARRVFGAAALKFPGDHRARYNYAIALAGDAKLPEAMAQLEAAISIEPRYSAPYVTYAKLLDTYRRDGLAVSAYLVFMMLEAQTPATPQAAAQVAMLVNRQVAVGADGKRTVRLSLPQGVGTQENALSVALATAAVKNGVGDPAVARADALLATLADFMTVAGDLAGKEQNFHSNMLLAHIQRLNESGRQAEFLRLVFAQAGGPAAAAKPPQP